MKRSLLPLLLLLVLSLTVTAQTISVKSFRALPMDMTASSLEGKRIDQNGEVAALIRVVTSETGFVFETGTLGIVDTKQKVGEIWVWVPRGSRKISIMHQQLGVLREYRYPIVIEAERTYELVLTTAKTETVIKEEVKEQYLMFQLTPPDAVIEVNDKTWTVSSDGVAKKKVDFGTYTYRVNAPNYYMEAGKVTVNDPDSIKRVDVVLRPKSGWIEVPDSDVVKGAEVYIDNSLVGKVPYKSDALNVGQHEVSIQKKGREPYIASVAVGENETIKVSPGKLVPKNKFFVTLNTAYSVAPQWSFGVSFGQMGRFGWFVSLMSNGGFRSSSAAGVCFANLGDGMPDGWVYEGNGGLPYYNGEYMTDRNSIIVGGLARLAKPVYLKLGVGYGSRNLYWLTEDDTYYLNASYSYKGLETSAGLQFDLGGFVLSLEAVTTDFKYLEGKLGLGYAF